MTDLIACLSSGKGTWAEVSKIIDLGQWNKVFLITDNFGKEKFTPSKQAEFIIVNSSNDIQELAESIRDALNNKLTDTEVALNLASGNGKEHMAVLSAALKLGVGIRMISLTNNKIKEI